MPVNEHATYHAQLPESESIEDMNHIMERYDSASAVSETMVHVPLQEISHLKERVRNMGDSIDNLKEENDELWNMLDSLSMRTDPNNSSADHDDQLSEEQEQKLIKTIIRLRSERNHYRQLWEQMTIKENLSSPYLINNSTPPPKGKKINLIKRVKEYIKSNTPVSERANMTTLEMMNYAWTHPASGQQVPEVTDVMKDLNKEEYNSHLNVNGNGNHANGINGAHLVHTSEDYNNGNTYVILNDLPK
jgi:regulator of replication initiation timing